MLTVAQVINRLRQVQPDTLPVAVEVINDGGERTLTAVVDNVALSTAYVDGEPVPAVVLLTQGVELADADDDDTDADDVG